MARRRVSRKLPLEWVSKWVDLPTKAVVYTDTLDLDLLPDEIAEIWNIDSYLAFTTAAAAGVDDISTINSYLSMDPDADKAPSLSATVEDLEVFFQHPVTLMTVVEATSTSVQRYKDESQKGWKAVDGKPILVGTNVGVVASYDTSADMFTAATHLVRVFFSRRRATAPELNQILLKRR